MILYLNFEEIRALRAGGHALLEGGAAESSPVLAPSEDRAFVEALLPRLEGDLSLGSLAEAEAMVVAVRAIADHLLSEMQTLVLATHAGDEGAVASYFEYAHSLSVAHRLDELVSEMVAVIELATGRPLDETSRRTFRFPD